MAAFADVLATPPHLPIWRCGGIQWRFSILSRSRRGARCLPRNSVTRIGRRPSRNTIIRLISVMSRLNLPGVGTPISELPSRNADKTTAFRKISVAAFDRKLDDSCLNVPDSDGAANDFAGDITFG